MTSAYETVEAALTGKFKVRPEKFAPEAPLVSLDLDSLDVVELLFTLGRDLGVRVGEDEVTSRHTVAELVATLDTKLALRAVESGR
ncbi:acyl carrier protein [Streptomyces sp. NPDC002537]